jgi:hypothetical protein
LLPLAALLGGWILAWLMGVRLRLGILVFLVLFFTDLFHLVPLGYLRVPGPRCPDPFPAAGRLSFPLVGYLHELTHHLEDPEWGLSEYLCRHARPSDVVLITYGDLTLQYYTPFRVVGGLQGQPLPTDPDWIIIRPFLRSTGPVGDKDVVDLAVGYVKRGPYTEIHVPSKDFPLGNSPEPEFHRFRMPERVPLVKVLKRDQPAVQPK